MRIFIFLIIISNIVFIVNSSAGTDVSKKELAHLIKGTVCEGRIEFVESLYKLSDPNYMSLIKSSLYDNCLMVRIAAIEAFGRLAGDKDASSLHTLLLNEVNNDFIIEEIFKALKRMHNTSTVEVIIDLLNREVLKDYWIFNALDLLASFETSQTISFLISFYKNSEKRAIDRYLALELLSDMKNDEGQSAFKLAIASEDPLILKMAEKIFSAKHN